MKYGKCPRCGGRVHPASLHEICSKCRVKMGNKSPYEGPRQGRRITVTTTTIRCKMPMCRKSFRVHPWQDPRYTWYCDSCRKKIAEITSGVQWHERMGIEIGVNTDGEEILMDSIAKAYDDAEDGTEMAPYDHPVATHFPANRRKVHRARKEMEL